jgi:hypothetical protein
MQEGAARAACGLIEFGLGEFDSQLGAGHFASRSFEVSFF